MSTPTPGKHPLSQQGRTPSQPQHGAAATPPVSTPFSVAQAAFSPHGPRSSPQQVKKSPATMSSSAAVGRSTMGAVNFESPSAAAALGALDMSSGLDLGLQSLGLGKASEDERARRLDAVISTLSKSKGWVSRAGLERLAKKLELEFIWEDAMGSSDKSTLIVAGSALELAVEFSGDVVQSVSLNYPDSAEIVEKHAKVAGEILYEDLRLEEGQSPLTKSLEKFAANFEQLAALDKLSVNPGLNLYESVAGIYESLCRLYTYELQYLREDPSITQKSEAYLENLVLCTRSGKPTMNARGRVGMTLDYWRRRRLVPPSPDLAAWAEKHERTWSILIGCAPLRAIGVSPVRISDKWIGPNVVKVPLDDPLHAGASLIDWLEPESTFLPSSDQTKPDPMQPEPSLLGPRLPDVVFHATFDPPIHIPLNLWQQIQQLGCMMSETQLEPVPFDSLVLPTAPGKAYDVTETRTIVCNQKVDLAPPDDIKNLSFKSHVHTLHVYKSVPSRTLSEMAFSHPQQLVTILPYLRQYTFLAMLLEHSFKETTPPTPTPPPTSPPTTAPVATPDTSSDEDEFHAFMSPDGEERNDTASEEPEPPLAIDVTLSFVPLPRLRISFPLRGGEGGTADVALEIHENGRVVVDVQNVLGERNAVAPNGRERRPEDVGTLLEMLEDIGKWAEFIRTRWA